MNCEEDRGKSNRLLPIEDKNEKQLLTEQEPKPKEEQK